MTRRTRIALVAAALIAAPNLANVVVPARPVVTGTCPRVFTIDDTGAHLGASVVAGALFPWAERRDVAPIGGLRAVDGAYTLRLASDAEATTVLDRTSLLVVDHDVDTEILATPAGRLVAVRDPIAPVSRTHGLAGELETISLEVARPSSPRALLVLEARSTAFAERAFFRYLATMGQGVSPLMEHAVRTDCGTACAREVMADELDRLGLPLLVTAGTRDPVHVMPTSPALLRRFAIPIELPAGDRATIRLQAAPGFWELGDVCLAPESAEVAAVTLDGLKERILVPPSSHVDLRFAAPPPGSGKRSVFVAVEAHYRVPIGGDLLHPFAILAHRWGVTTLPRFAATHATP